METSKTIADFSLEFYTLTDEFFPLLGLKNEMKIFMKSKFSHTVLQFKF